MCRSHVYGWVYQKNINIFKLIFVIFLLEIQLKISNYQLFNKKIVTIDMHHKMV